MVLKRKSPAIARRIIAKNAFGVVKERKAPQKKGKENSIRRFSEVQLPYFRNIYLKKSLNHKLIFNLYDIN